PNFCANAVTERTRTVLGAVLQKHRDWPTEGQDLRCVHRAEQFNLRFVQAVVQGEAHFHSAYTLYFREPCLSGSVLSLEPFVIQDRHAGSGCATWARDTHRLPRPNHFAPEWIVTKRWPHYRRCLVDLAH